MPHVHFRCRAYCTQTLQGSYLNEIWCHMRNSKAFRQSTAAQPACANADACLVSDSTDMASKRAMALHGGFRVKMPACDYWRAICLHKSRHACVRQGAMRSGTADRSPAQCVTTGSCSAWEAGGNERIRGKTGAHWTHIGTIRHKYCMLTSLDAFALLSPSESGNMDALTKLGETSSWHPRS